MNDAHQQDMADLAAQEAEDRALRIRAGIAQVAQAEAHAALEQGHTYRQMAWARLIDRAALLLTIATLVTLALLVRASW